MLFYVHMGLRLSMHSDSDDAMAQCSTTHYSAQLGNTIHFPLLSAALLDFSMRRFWTWGLDKEEDKIAGRA
jgi:hypothetical protein